MIFHANYNHYKKHNNDIKKSLGILILSITMSTWSRTSRRQCGSANYNHYNKHDNNVKQHNLIVLVVPIAESPISTTSTITLSERQCVLWYYKAITTRSTISKKLCYCTIVTASNSWVYYNITTITATSWICDLDSFILQSLNEHHIWQSVLS